RSLGSCLLPLRVAPETSVQQDGEFGGHRLGPHGATLRAAVQGHEAMAFEGAQGTREIAGGTPGELGQLRHCARLAVTDDPQQLAVLVRKHAGELPPRIEPDRRHWDVAVSVQWLA